MNAVELKPFNLVVCHPRGDFHFIRDCPLANKKCAENMVKQIKFVLLAKSTPLNDDLRI